MGVTEAFLQVGLKPKDKGHSVKVAAPNRLRGFTQTERWPSYLCSDGSSLILEKCTKFALCGAAVALAYRGARDISRI